MTRFAAKYRRVARSLSRVALMRSSMDETFALTDADLLDKDGGRRFLDFYGDEGLRLALERYGLFDAIRARGWDDFTLATHALDDRHTLLMDATAPDGTTARLLELVVRRDRLRIEGIERAFETLTIDWLGLRDPRARFTEARMRLPGQDAPGLGVGERVLELLYRVVDRLGLDALCTVAEYFHNAVLYARELVYVDPACRGQLEALEALLFGRERLGFAQAAWAVHWGLVRGPDDAAFAWRGEAMVRPRDPWLLAHLTDRAHTERAHEVASHLRYTLARAELEERWAAEHDALLGPP